MARVILDSAAQDDLIEIWSYVAQDSVVAANRLLDAVSAKCRLLATQPKMGQLRPELAPRLRSFSVGNYVLFFRPIDDGIELARVIHAAREIGEEF